MLILKTRFRRMDDFLDSFSPEVPGALFCPTTSRLTEKQKVIIDLKFPGLPNRVMILGTVQTWRPALPRLRVRAGATVEFAATETDKLQFLRNVVQGKEEEYPKRRHVRIPVDFPVRWRPQDSAEYMKGGIHDISLGGAFLRSAVDLPVGTEVILNMDVPGVHNPVTLAGKVAYSLSGQGNGIKFLYRDGGGSRRIRELLRRIQAQE